MRILGLDYGSKTVGVAVSDPLGLTAQERGYDLAKTGKQAASRPLRRIEALVEEYRCRADRGRLSEEHE